MSCRKGTRGGGEARGVGGGHGNRSRRQTATSRDWRRLERRCSWTSTGSTQSRSRTRSNWSPGLVGSSCSACMEPAQHTQVSVQLLASWWDRYQPAEIDPKECGSKSNSLLSRPTVSSAALTQASCLELQSSLGKADLSCDGILTFQGCTCT